MADRTVEIELRVKPAAENAKAAKDVAKAVGEAHAAEVKGAAESAASQKKIAAQLTKELEKELATRGTLWRGAEIAERNANIRSLEAGVKDAQRKAGIQDAIAKLAEERRKERETADAASAKKAEALANKAAAVAEKAASREARAYEQAQQVKSQALNKFSSSLGQLATGLGLLGISQSESFEQAVKWFAVVRGGVDTVRGLVGVYNSSVAVLQAYAATAKLAAAAQVALNVAQASGGGGAVKGAATQVAGAAVAKGAATKAAGSAAGSVAGGAVAGAAGTVATGGFFGGLTAMATGLASAMAPLAVIAGGAVVGIELFDRALSGGREGLSTWWKALKDAEQSTKDVEKAKLAREKKLAERDEANSKAAQRFSAERQARQSDNSLLDREGKINGKGDNVTGEEARGKALLDVLRARATLNQEIAIAEERQEQGKFAALDGQKLALDNLRDAQDQLTKREEDRLTLLQKESKELETQLERSKSVVEQEQKKVDAATQKFGALSKNEQDVLKRLEGKVKDGGVGSLTDADKGFLQDRGFGGGIVADEQVKGAKAAGSDSFLETFGLKDGLNEATRQRDELLKEYQEANRKAEAQKQVALMQLEQLKAIAAAIGGANSSEDGEGIGDAADQVSQQAVRIGVNLKDVVGTLAAKLKKANEDTEGALLALANAAI